MTGVDATTLLSLLGRPAEDPVVRTTMAALGVSLPAFGADFVTQGFPSQFGAAVNFKAAKFVRGAAPATAENPHPVVIDTVFFYGPGYASGPFEGDLPHGFRFDESREEAHRRLGRPTSLNPQLPIDRWETENEYVVAQYRKDAQAIRLLKIGLFENR